MKKLFTILIFICLIFAYGMFYTVNETSHAIVTRFGEITQVVIDPKFQQPLVFGKDSEIIEIKSNFENEIKNDPRFRNVTIKYGKGLFLKLPILDSVTYYDNRLLTYDTDPREVVTSDKKKLIIDNNGQWIITNPLLYRVSMISLSNANTRIDDIIYSRLNERIGRTPSDTLISDKIAVREMLKDLVVTANNDLQTYGVRVIDSQIKKTDLPKENLSFIYTRMKTEREQKAKLHRSEGLESSQTLKSEADKEVTIIEAEAYRQSQELRGEGDASATKIYNDVYNQDPDFFEFYKTLDTYSKTINDKTTIVIDSNSPFAKYILKSK